MCLVFVEKLHKSEMNSLVHPIPKRCLLYQHQFVFLDDRVILFLQTHIQWGIKDSCSCSICDIGLKADWGASIIPDVHYLVCSFVSKYLDIDVKETKQKFSRFALQHESVLVGIRQFKNGALTIH